MKRKKTKKTKKDEIDTAANFYDITWHCSTKI